MKILLMGCSYGVPNYSGPPGDPADTHTEFLLRDQGHLVMNCSQNGASNLETLQRAQQWLETGCVAHPAYPAMRIKQAPFDPDLVIWFHTELGRDIPQSHGFDLLQEIERVAERVYRCYQDFLQRLPCKLAVIGGAGDLHHCFDRWLSPDFCIPKWRSELCGRDLPASQTLCLLDLVENCGNTISQKMQVLEKDSQIRAALTASEMFPDNIHPGAAAHADLVQRLLSQFATQYQV